ncbi:MAG: formylmethanofuran--tetrahydromethanopterin formyltransferase [miscellaneous Crenarchaeota group-6 archaeon AD8-1]|nr:MAG: formylmethanofuran--tetrahydromethanopterin formyltransferase [miscellaneous Crenarchaeota group-6 archaeon AD8-1]
MIDINRVDNTYAEAFEGIYSRVIITADDEVILKKAAEDSTSTPSVVIGRIEGGVEKWLHELETPDKRKGAVLQFWGAIRSGKTFEESVQRFETELSYRIRQDILVKPFTAVFNALDQAEGKMDMMLRIGHCGDGFEWIENRLGKEIIIVPLMVPDFIIERYLGFARGIMGANFWIMCETKEAVNQVGKKILKVIHKTKGVITPFDVCSAGSKPETRFPLIGPTTNHPYCFSLKKKLGSLSRVPNKVKYIPEIVINGVSMESVKDAMKRGIEAALEIDGVSGISAGNYGGKLGEYKIKLVELFS